MKEISTMPTIPNEAFEMYEYLRQESESLVGAEPLPVSYVVEWRNGEGEYFCVSSWFDRHKASDYAMQQISSGCLNVQVVVIPWMDRQSARGSRTFKGLRMIYEQRKEI